MRNDARDEVMDDSIIVCERMRATRRRGDAGSAGQETAAEVGAPGGWQARKLWEAMEGLDDVRFCWFRLAQDAGGLLLPAAEAVVFQQLLQLPLHQLQSMRALDCFLAFFVDANASAAGRSATVHVIGRDGTKPGHRLSLLSLVGRRIALRALDDKKMHLATVTKYERTQWVSRYSRLACRRRPGCGALDRGRKVAVGQVCVGLGQGRRGRAQGPGR